MKTMEIMDDGIDPENIRHIGDNVKKMIEN